MPADEGTTAPRSREETVRRLFDAFEANDQQTMVELLAPTFIAHGLPPEFGEGPAALTTCAAVLHAGLSDCRAEIDDLIAAGERVALRYTARATHSGELFGAAPTGRAVTLTGIEISTTWPAAGSWSTGAKRTCPSCSPGPLTGRTSPCPSGLVA